MIDFVEIKRNELCEHDDKVIRHPMDATILYEYSTGNVYSTYSLANTVIEEEDGDLIYVLRSQNGIPCAFYDAQCFLPLCVFVVCNISEEEFLGATPNELFEE